MNINNFEENINDIILNRGYDYYNEGNIAEKYEHENDEYVFIVEGSEDYEVTVQLDGNGEIIYSDCDCPYDFGHICKHQVAAYFELRDFLNRKSDTKEVVKQPELKEVLNNLPKEDLISIIVDISKKDAALKNSIIFRYSKGDDIQELNKCKKLMDSIVKKHLGRGRFIEYDETYDFISDMEDLLEKIRGICEDNNNPLLALDVAFLVLKEAIEAFQYADDSDGHIGGFVSETITLIEEIVCASKNEEIKLREKMFQKLLDLIDSPEFEDWEEYITDIIGICAEFADVEEFRNKLKIKIELLVNENSNNEYRRYSIERMLQVLFAIIDEYETKEESEEFIKENLKFSSFRELFINKFIEEKNYLKVIELALEGEIKDKQYAGLVSKWKKIRYAAYKELSLKEEQEKLAKELLFHGDFTYYKELKELHKVDEKLFYDALKQELKKDKSWRGISMYLKVIVEEKDLDEIMEFVRENPRDIEEYADMLMEKCKDEVIEIYKKSIKLQANSASKRKHYQEVCRMLKRFKGVAGKEKLTEMVNELISLYRKRPAFVDELSKVR